MYSSSVYKIKNVYYICAYSQTTTGLWMESDPSKKFNTDIPVSEKGKYILEITKASKHGIKHPTDWSKITSPILEITKMKSWSNIHKRASSCSINIDKDLIKIMPYRNLGTREGYKEILDKVQEIPVDSSHEEIGALLDKTFELCE